MPRKPPLPPRPIPGPSRRGARRSSIPEGGASGRWRASRARPTATLVPVAKESRTAGDLAYGRPAWRVLVGNGNSCGSSLAWGALARPGIGPRNGRPSGQGAARIRVGIGPRAAFAGPRGRRPREQPLSARRGSRGCRRRGRGGSWRRRSARGRRTPAAGSGGSGSPDARPRRDRDVASHPTAGAVDLRAALVGCSRRGSDLRPPPIRSRRLPREAAAPREAPRCGSPGASSGCRAGPRVWRTRPALGRGERLGQRPGALRSRPEGTADRELPGAPRTGSLPGAPQAPLTSGFRRRIFRVRRGRCR